MTTHNDAPSPTEHVEFTRIDEYRPDHSHTVRYRCRCRTCNLNVDASALREFVHRYDIADVPYRSQLGSDAAYEAYIMVDTLDHGPEKRAQNARAKSIERQLEERARWALHQAGCPHAMPERAAHEQAEKLRRLMDVAEGRG